MSGPLIATRGPMPPACADSQATTMATRSRSPVRADRSMPGNPPAAAPKGRIRRSRLPDGSRKRLTKIAVAAYAQGASIREIAAATGRSYHSVYNALNDAGVVMRPRGNGLPDAERKQLQKVAVAAYARGDGVPEIAAATGRSYSSVRRALKDAGVVMRPGGRRMSDTERKQLQKAAVGAYEQGDTVREIAAATGRADRTVRKALKDAGVAMHSGGSGLPEAESKQLQKVAAAAYRRGDTIGEIVAATGRSRAVVRKALLDAGVKLRTTGQRLSKAERRQLQKVAVTAYERGDTMAEIAAATGRSRAAVRKALRDAGVELRTTGRRLSETERDHLKEVAVAAYEQGDTVRKIAASTGYSYGGVHKVLVDAGVTLRPTGLGPLPPAGNGTARTAAQPDLSGTVMTR